MSRCEETEKHPIMAARIFLYTIAGIITLILAAGIAWTLFSEQILRWALVPSAPIEQLESVEESVYADRGLWLVRPDIEDAPSDWLPQGYGEPLAALPADMAGSGERIPVFFVLPTTYYDNDRWNAPFHSEAAMERQNAFAASQASVFNEIGELWIPHYRQAAIGVFLTDQPEAAEALGYAYRDVETAFAYFLSQIGEDSPFIVAGHSQGALHLLTLLAGRADAAELRDRIVAAYLVGWPISVGADLPALPLPACDRPRQAGCIVAYQSFAEPADPEQFLRRYEASTGLTGESRAGTPTLCVNPITGSRDGSAPAGDNRGALLPDDDLGDARFEAGLIPARCDDLGLLLVGSPPDDYGEYVLPGNNYHVFDYMLFWENLRDDVARRAAAYGAQG